MDLKELLGSLKNEDGVINFDDINFQEIEDANNKKIGQLLKKEREKATAKVEQVKNEREQDIKNLESEKSQNDEALKTVLARLEKLEQENKRTQREKTELEFTKRANDLKLDKGVIDVLLKSVDDLSALDNDTLKQFKRVDIEIPKDVVNKDEKTDKELEQSYQSKVSQGVDELLKRWGKK